MPGPGSDAVRFIDGIEGIFHRIKEEEWPKIDKASTIIAEALLAGHRVYCISEGHVTPLANAFGTPGNPDLFLPYDLLVGHFSFVPTVSMKGDVLVVFGHFDSSPFPNEVVTKCRVLGAYSIFVGSPSDRNLIPATLPSLRLPELCDLTIETFTPPLEGLLKFDGLEVEACPTTGVTGVLMFHVLNIEVAEKLSRRVSEGAVRHSAGPEDDAETPLYFKGLAEKK